MPARAMTLVAVPPLKTRRSVGMHLMLDSPSLFPSAAGAGTGTMLVLFYSGYQQVWDACCARSFWSGLAAA